MAYTSALGNDFWFAFDDAFKDHPTPQASAAIVACFPGFALDLYVKKWIADYKAATLPADFLTFVTPRAHALQTLADLQDAVFVASFQGSLPDEQSAYEDFGQGVLYDPRRAVGNRVHMMDIDGQGQEVGYQRWYCFAYALKVLGYKQQVWGPRLNFIALALAIHLAAKPTPDSQARPSANPALAAGQLQQLRTQWMGATEQDTNKLVFDSSVFK